MKKNENYSLKRHACIFAFVLFLLSACNPGFEPVDEYVKLSNKTNGIVYVYNPLASQDQINSKLYAKDSVIHDTLNNWHEWCRPEVTFKLDKPAKNQLWLSKDEFRRQINGLIIYKLLEGDTLVVDPTYYNDREKWESERMYSYGSETMCTHYLNLTIVDSMFVRK